MIVEIICNEGTILVLDSEQLCTMLKDCEKSVQQGFAFVVHSLPFSLSHDRADLPVATVKCWHEGTRIRKGKTGHVNTSCQNVELCNSSFP